MVPKGKLAFAKLGKRTLECYQNCDGLYKWSDYKDVSEWPGCYTDELALALAAVLQAGGKIISKKQADKREKKHRR